MGGVGWFPTQWSETWDTQPVFSLDPTVRVTMIGSLIATTVWWVCTAGSDQMAIQRYLATRDVKSARKAFLINNIADVCVNVTLISLGFALLGFFREHYPELLRATLADEKKGDYLFPLFVVNFMKFGTAGLVIAGMLAAAMSSLSSGLNSAATVLNTDFLPLLLRKPLDEKTKVRHGMAVSAVIGVIIILLALVIENVRGNLFEVTQKTSNLLVSPLFSLFFLALFVKRANTFCAMFAAAYGFVVAIVIAFWDLTGATPISFQWIGITSLLASVGAGVALSFLPWDRMTRNSRSSWVSPRPSPCDARGTLHRRHRVEVGRRQRLIARQQPKNGDMFQAPSAARLRVPIRTRSLDRRIRSAEPGSAPFCKPPPGTR